MHGSLSDFSISIAKKMFQLAQSDKRCGKRRTQMFALEKSLVYTKQRWCKRGTLRTLLIEPWLLARSIFQGRIADLKLFSWLRVFANYSGYGFGTFSNTSSG